MFDTETRELPQLNGYEKFVVLIGAAQICFFQLWLRGLCLADYYYPPQRFQSLVLISFSFVSSSYLGGAVVLATVIAIHFSIHRYSQHHVVLDLNIDFDPNE
jgi:hypothetical protein